MSRNMPLDIDRIEAARENARIGRKIVVFQRTSSTNDIAAEYANNPDNDGLCILAEAQTAGRGRRGRTWFSEPGHSILCSILLTKTHIEAELLTLTTAVAVAEAINQSKYNHGQADPSTALGTGLDRATRPATQLQCRIKWPNDILIRDQKVAGILVEKRVRKNHPCFVVGIGINCNQTRETFDQYNLNLPATSLAIEASAVIDRTALVCELLEQFEMWLDKSRVGTAHPTDNPIIERWLQLSQMLGRHITVECDGQRYSGFCRGIDPAKGLILQIDNSLVRMFSAAQTSIFYEMS